MDEWLSKYNDWFCENPLDNEFVELAFKAGWDAALRSNKLSHVDQLLQMAVDNNLKPNVTYTVTIDPKKEPDNG